MVTVNVPAAPTVNVAVLALVNAGDLADGQREVLRRADAAAVAWP